MGTALIDCMQEHMVTAKGREGSVHELLPWQLSALGTIPQHTLSNGDTCLDTHSREHTHPLVRSFTYGKKHQAVGQSNTSLHFARRATFV